MGHLYCIIFAFSRGFKVYIFCMWILNRYRILENEFNLLNCYFDFKVIFLFPLCIDFVHVLQVLRFLPLDGVDSYF